MLDVHRESEGSQLVRLLHEGVRLADVVAGFAVHRGSAEEDEAVETKLIETLLELGLESADDRDGDADVDIWAETSEADEVSLEAITSATLNRLVELLTAPQTTDAADRTRTLPAACFDCVCANRGRHADLRFTKTFLMTYRSFTTSERVLAKLAQRYNVPPAFAAKRTPIQLRVVNVLSSWIEN